MQPRTKVAAILMCVLGTTAPDIEPAREAQAVARRIAAAHDRHPLARRDRHVRREMQTAQGRHGVKLRSEVFLKCRTVTRDKWDGDTDEAVHLRLHRRPL